MEVRSPSKTSPAFHHAPGERLLRLADWRSVPTVARVAKRRVTLRPDPVAVPINGSVTVRVPASTSNLGSGFDTLGLAVRLYNWITARRRPDASRTISAEWEMDKGDRDWFAETLDKTAALFFQRTSRHPFGVTIRLRGDVPVARGLGASATVRVGLLAALNILAGTRLSREELLELATELEGHPDNASPALFGGFTVSGRVASAEETSVRCLNFPVSGRLKLVTLIPRFGISTEHARRLLPQGYTRADAAHALNRSALITAAICGQRYEDLRGVFDDRIHQPYREKLLPQLSAVIQAGVAAGALGGFLSGSGSSIICLTLENAAAVGRAMRRALPDSDIKVLTADNKGVKVSPKQRSIIMRS
jgi:homoserine kinase